LVRDFVFAAQFFVYLFYICTPFLVGRVCSFAEAAYIAGRFGDFVK